MLQEHDRIVLTEDLASGRLKGGDVGTIVHIRRGGEALPPPDTMIHCRLPVFCHYRACAETANPAYVLRNANLFCDN